MLSMKMNEMATVHCRNIKKNPLKLRPLLLQLIQYPKWRSVCTYLQKLSCGVTVIYAYYDTDKKNDIDKIRLFYWNGCIKYHFEQW